jgi:hypothetical protein
LVFSKTIGRQARKGVVYTLTDAGKIVLEFFGCCRKCSFVSKSKLRSNEEFKQDGLLMLEFSNSQSRKEFTGNEKITQDYAEL